VVGGRSSAAVRRAGRLGDGWLGVWCSPERFGAVVREIDGHARDAGRPAIDWHHGLQVWCGLERSLLAAAMEDMYKTPFARFEKYAPWGSPAAIADFLAPYAAAGCREFNVMVVAEADEVSIDAVAEIRRRLAG
jgi:alkanesulfonate monooxygenase SsuD/methylene tetrahydromethanopterin reductase-like flavin-dependent oxidoreductase (luciferase family)